MGMGGLRYLDILTTAEKLSTVNGQRDTVKLLALQAVGRIAAAYDWPYLWTTDFFSTVAEYTTGNVTVTNGDATVSGGSSSPAFTAAMVGRKFRISGQSAYYTIKSRTSATELELDQPFQGDSASDQSYSIFQDEYLLRADADLYKVIRQVEDGRPLISRNVSDFDRSIAAPEAMGSASLEMLLGREVTTYETGTVSIPSSSRILTSNGTSWLSVRGLSRGSKVRVGSVLYTVNTVDSDTQLTVYEAASTAASGSAYAILIDNIKVQLYTIPDAVENYYYRFPRIPAPMDRDADYPDLPSSLHMLIVEEMLSWLWQFKGQPEKALTSRQSYEINLQKAMARYGNPTPDRLYQRASCDVALDRQLRTQWLLGV